MRTIKQARKAISAHGYVRVLRASVSLLCEMKRAGYVVARIPDGDLVVTEETIAKVRGYGLVPA